MDSTIKSTECCVLVFAPGLRTCLALTADYIVLYLLLVLVFMGTVAVWCGNAESVG